MGLRAYGRMGRNVTFPGKSSTLIFTRTLGADLGATRPQKQQGHKSNKAAKQQGHKSNKATKATRPQKRQATKISLFKDFTSFSREPALDFQVFHVIFKGPGVGFSRISRHFQGPRHWIFRFRVIFNGSGLRFSRISCHFQRPRTRNPPEHTRIHTYIC